MEIAATEPWQAQAKAVGKALATLVPKIVGVYLHGSAALGGIGPASDLDVLVVADPEPGRDWEAVGRELLTMAAGERSVELSIVEPRAAAEPTPPWPFVLHVNTGEQRFVVGDEGGDPDLIAHYAVVRAAGLVLHGVDARAVVGAVERGVLLEYLADELEWGRTQADQRYAVLNACRAVAYSDDGALLSKIDGGRWWLERSGPDPLVVAALHAQAAGVDLGGCGADAQAFVETAITRLGQAPR